jgi:hypothetical protein
MKNIHAGCLITMCLIASFLSAGIPENMQYVFPGDGSRYVALNSNIIIRPGDRLDASMIQPDMLTVVGEKSGRISVQPVLSSDGRTLVIYPDRPFKTSEKVTVGVLRSLKDAQGNSVAPFEFTFETTQLQEPLNPYETIESLRPLRPSAPAGPAEKAELPGIEVTLYGETAPGDLFIAPTKFTTYDGYLVTLNNSGEVLYQENHTEGVPLDFTVQPNGLLSYGLMYEYFTFAGGGYTNFYTMDSTYSVIETYQMKNGYIADFHDFRLLPNGHVLLFGYDLQPVDMSDLVEGGRPDALVAGSIIQELDVYQNVVLQWRSWDYYDILDTYNDVTQRQFDAIHINSVDVDSDGQLIVSALALGEITKINRLTGEIIWHLGGKNNQFTFINESEEHAPLYFMFQHDVRVLDNGNITIFDNGSSQFGRTYSRAVEYQIDETQKTATKVWEYRPSPDIFVPTMGNIQRLPNGNSLICWGFASMNGGLAATEVDPDGNKLMDVTFSENGWTTYRAFRFPYNGGRPAVKVVIYEVQESNDYEFVEGDKSIGVSMTITYKPGSGYNEVHGYYYQTAPFEPQFPELAPVVLPQRFVMDRFAIDQMQADLDFDVAYFNLENPESITVYHREFEGRGMFFPLNTTYNPVTGKIRASMRKFGEFIFVREVTQPEMQPPILAFPENGSRVNQTLPLELAWSARGYAIYFDLQVARDSLFTQLVLDESDLMEQSYTMESLDATVYYWRVRASTDFDTSAWAMARFDAVAPFLQVTSPAAGEELTVGLRHFIEWEDNLDEDILVELYLQDTPVAVLDTVETVKAYYWDVPFQMELGDLYRIRISSVSSPELFDFSDYFTLTDNAEPPPPEVEAYHLYHCQPNPVLTETLVRYDLPVESRVKLEVFDVLGRRVAVLIDGWIGKGPRSVQWKPRIGQGIYYIRLKAAPLESDEFSSYEKVRKAVVLK